MKYSRGNKFYHPMIEPTINPNEYPSSWLNAVCAVLVGIAVGGIMTAMIYGWFA